MAQVWQMPLQHLLTWLIQPSPWGEWGDASCSHLEVLQRKNRAGRGSLEVATDPFGKSHICCWEVWLPLQIHVQVPIGVASRSGRPPACPWQELGGTRRTGPAVWALDLIVKAWLAVICHQFGSWMLKCLWTPVTQKKTERMRFGRGLLTAELPAPKPCNTCGDGVLFFVLNLSCQS